MRGLCVLNATANGHTKRARAQQSASLPHWESSSHEPEPQRNRRAGMHHLSSEWESRWWPTPASQITAIPQCHGAGTKRHCGPRRWAVEEPALGMHLGLHVSLDCRPVAVHTLSHGPPALSAPVTPAQCVRRRGRALGPQSGLKTYTQLTSAH